MCSVILFPDKMDTGVYLLMLYVTREQEEAISLLFKKNKWTVLKSGRFSATAGPVHFHPKNLVCGP